MNLAKKPPASNTFAILTAGIVWVLVTVPACSQEEFHNTQWPSFAERVLKDFATQKADIEALRDLLADSSLQDVTRLSEDFYVAIDDDDRSVNVADIENFEALQRLMEKTDVYLAVDFGPISSLVRTRIRADDREDRVFYLFDHPLLAKQCLDEHRDLSCGVCRLGTRDGWEIRYSWSSGQHEIDRNAPRRKDVSGELSEKEEDEAYKRRREECYRDGLTEMGYEHPEYWD